MADTPDLPPLPTDLTIFTAKHIEKIRAYAREAVRLAARASVPADVALYLDDVLRHGTPSERAVASTTLYWLTKSAPAVPTPPDEASDALDAARYRAWRAAYAEGGPCEALLSALAYAGTPDAIDAAIDAMKDAARTQGDRA